MNLHQSVSVLRMKGLSMVFLLRRYSSAVGLMEVRVCRGLRSHSSRRISTRPASATLDQGSGGSGSDTITEHSLEKTQQQNNTVDGLEQTGICIIYSIIATLLSVTVTPRHNVERSLLPL